MASELTCTAVACRTRVDRPAMCDTLEISDSIVAVKTGSVEFVGAHLNAATRIGL